MPLIFVRRAELSFDKPTCILSPQPRQFPCKTFFTKLHKNETNECAGEERGKCRADNEKTLFAMLETTIGKGKQYLADLQFL